MNYFYRFKSPEPAFSIRQPKEWAPEGVKDLQWQSCTPVQTVWNSYRGHWYVTTLFSSSCKFKTTKLINCVINTRTYEIYIR